MEFSDTSTFSLTEMKANNEIILCIFFMKIVHLLEELKIVSKRTNQRSLMIESIDITGELLCIVEKAVTIGRKVVINEKIEIDYSGDNPYLLSEKTQPLAVTFSHGSEQSEKLKNFLQQMFSDCSVTAKL